MTTLFSDSDVYLTLAPGSVAEALYKEKGSKFLTYAYHIATEDDLKKYLAALRKQYFDATHHCYAYSLGVELPKTRANDDGEPNGTAGLPILNQIKSKQLHNVLVVAVRYYGGTKLGASGLVNAYKTSAQMVLEQAQLIEKIMSRPLSLSFDYLAMNEVMKVVKDYELKILAQQFDNQCTMTLDVRKKFWNVCIEKLSDIQRVQLINP